MTTREPEWDASQRGWLLASRAIEADTGQYGERLSEALDPKASPFYHEDDAIRFDVVGPAVNQAVKAVEDAQDDRKKKYPDAPTNGLIWGVKRR